MALAVIAGVFAGTGIIRMTLGKFKDASILLLVSNFLLIGYAAFV